LFQGGGNVQKRSLFLMAIGLFTFALLALMPTLAQDQWAMYLYNGNAGQLIRVNPDGSQAMLTLALEPNVYLSGFDMAFTRDGARMAYCSVAYPLPTDGSVPPPPAAKFILRDINAQSNLLSLDLGTAIGCRTGRRAFSGDESQVAVTRINYYMGDPAADTTQPSWQILLLDAANGNVVRELNAASPSVASVEDLTKGAILPYAQYVTENQVVFAAVPYGVGGGGEWNAYVWQFDTDTVQPVPRWGNINMDTLQETGELVWATQDANLPTSQGFGEMPNYNAVKVADKTGEEHTIFNSPDSLVLDVRFINGGQQVAIELFVPPDPNQPTPFQTLKWVALDRNGGVVDLVSNGSGTVSVAPAPNGYVVFNQEIVDLTNGSSHFSLTYNAGGQSQTLWDSQEQNVFWELAWVTPLVVSGDIQPFKPVA
jgi:hypothetical protein